MNEDYLSVLGYGAVMGLLRHWDAVGALMSCSTDAFNRLRPGFEAPICPVVSLGHNVGLPSRNRSVLAGLVRDLDNPKATRFEVRAPNPHSNSYLAIAAMYMAMLDGIEHVLTAGRSAPGLQKEISKDVGEPGVYLDESRAYRSEEDVFEHYTQADRDRLFGVPPATVRETLDRLESYPGRDELFCAGKVFTPDILRSYSSAMLARWRLELSQRLVPANMETVRRCRRLHGADADAGDEAAWNEIQALRIELLKDTGASPSLFTRLVDAIDRQDDRATSELQLEMNQRMADLREQYSAYARNLLDVMPADVEAGVASAYQLLPTGRLVFP